MLKLKDLLESHHDRKEGKMAKYDVKEIAQDAMDVFKMIDEEDDLPEWLEAKITKAADYMNSVKDYLTHHSDDSDNENQSQNEDMKNTSKVMKSVRKGPKVGPWDIIVSKNNKIVKRVLVKNLKEIPAEMSDLRDKYPNHVIGIESKVGKIVYRESMNKRQGGETLKQLGGNKFIAMTGAKNFAVGPKGMGFKIGRNSKGVNYVRIDLDRGKDLYNMEFIQMRAGKLKVKSKVKGVYNDQLQKMFTKHTGMYTSLGTMGR